MCSPFLNQCKKSSELWDLCNSYLNSIFGVFEKIEILNAPTQRRPTGTPTTHAIFFVKPGVGSFILNFYIDGEDPRNPTVKEIQTVKVDK